MGKSNFAETSPVGRFLNSNLGFTLIELLVVILILSVLISMSLFILNPITQIKKSQDSQRQHDLKQLATALDSYYNDNNYYPQSPTILVTASNIQAIPNDPTVSSSWPNYAYVEDQSDNPQWNVLFAKTAFPSSSSFACPLEQMSSCLPQNYGDLGYNYCVISGNVNCTQIAAATIVPLPITASPATNTPTPTSTLTPTPVPFVCYCRDATYWKDITKDPNHWCQTVQVSSDPSVNSDRSCSASCDEPCTP
ncbi:MAG TPA: type II secretion system protein [Patescibacteria group bacterium]|nr:type II secretion system protein [Patescibacteria group bacterium]